MSEFLIIVGLILLNGVFAMTEIAMISARKSSLSADAKKGNRSAKLAITLINEPDRFLSTIQIGITLIGILTGIYSGAALADDFSKVLLTWNVPVTYAHPIAQLGIVVLVTYLTLVFGELVPKRIGLAISERTARFMARPMYILSLIATPFVWILAKSTSVLFNLMGLKSSEGKVTEDEIKSIIQEGKEGGEVQEVEQDIVERVFLLGDLKVAALMTHRSDMVALDVSMTKEEVKRVLEENIYESYPVINHTFDHVVGVVSLKVLILALDKVDFDLAKLARPAMFFHENMSVYKALEQFKVKKVSRALIFDEFGICQGIITLKDILEGLVGDIDDADYTEPEIIKRVGTDSWLVDGQISFYNFLVQFEMEDASEMKNYKTLGGLILDKLKHIPQSGEYVYWHMLKLEIVDMDGARIDKIMVSKVDQ